MLIIKHTCRCNLKAMNGDSTIVSLPRSHDDPLPISSSQPHDNPAASDLTEPYDRPPSLPPPPLTLPAESQVYSPYDEPPPYEPRGGNPNAYIANKLPLLYYCYVMSGQS